VGGSDNLIPWKPGQTGNPNGSSNMRRKAKRLREALDLILRDPVPSPLLADLQAEVTDALPEGVTFAELIALRAVIFAARATRPAELMGAVALLLGAQAKPDELKAVEKVGPPILPSTEERRAAIAEQLGLDDGDTPTIN
jgi:hypothetical protein